VNYYVPEGRRAELQRDTEALIGRLERSNTEMHAGREARGIQVGGETALLSTLYSRSLHRDEREVDVLVTVARREGLFYVVFVAPESEFDRAQGTFEKVLTSIRFE